MINFTTVLVLLLDDTIAIVTFYMYNTGFE